MRLGPIGRCGNCRALTSRVVAASDDESDDKRSRHVHQCRSCTDKGVKPVAHEKRPKKGAALPRHIEDALDDARYLMRSADDSGFPRFVVTIRSIGSIALGGARGEDISERIQSAWPELDDAQVHRVVKHIQSGCASVERALTERPGVPRKRFVTDY